MQTIQVRTTQNVVIQYPLASIGDRILAHIIDQLIKVVYVVALVAAILRLEIQTPWLIISLIAVPLFLYALLFEIFMNGQTPGKRAMNIQVVRLDGTEASIGDYLLRWIFSLVDFGFLSGALAVIVIAVNGKGQRIGDIVAGTTVVKLLAQKEITAEEIFIEPASTHQPTFPEVSNLNPQDIELIRRALDAFNHYQNDQPALAIAEKLKETLKIQTDMYAVQFLETVVKDYNHYTSK